MRDWRGAEAALLAASTPKQMLEKMAFSVIETPEEKFAQLIFEGGQQRIFAEGPLDAEAAERFHQFVRDRGIEWAKVRLNSPGGSLIGGLRLGRLIRDLKFDTEIGAKNWEYGDPPAALCASAAGYAFAGGIHRFYREDMGSLGIHQFHDGKNNQGDLGQAQRVSGLLVAYLQEMGVDPAVFSLAASTSSSDMIWLGEDEAVRLRFANNGTESTTSEIKVREGQTYLRLEQRHHNVIARVLIHPGPDKFAVSAGIVTTKETSEMKVLSLVRSYIELDWEEIHPLAENEGVFADDCTVWVLRAFSHQELQKLLLSETMGIWLENGGPMRWGAMMDLLPVRSAISNFVDGCAVRVI